MLSLHRFNIHHKSFNASSVSLSSFKVLQPVVQVIQWSPMESQGSRVRNRHTLQRRQSAGDAQVDRVLLDSVQDDTGTQLFMSQHRKMEEIVGK